MHSVEQRLMPSNIVLTPLLTLSPSDVDNLEKQHMLQLKDAILHAISQRRRLLLQLTASSNVSPYHIVDSLAR